MEKKNGNTLVIIIMGVIIIILLVLCVLFAFDVIEINNKESENNTQNNNTLIDNGEYNTLIKDNEDNNTTSNYDEENNPSPIKDLNTYKGTWLDEKTQNELTITNISEGSITFNWFLYRLALIDEDVTIDLKNNKGIFYFEGYDDKNFDGKDTEDEKFIRKATLELTKDGVNITIKDVNKVDDNYVVLDQYTFSGSVYVTPGDYVHNKKK